MEELCWADRGALCPHCGCGETVYIQPANGTSRKTRTGAQSERRVWRCKTCRKQFSVISGTVFHGTKVALRIWLLVLFEMCASKNGIAAREVERKYGVCARTAWFMMHRIREAMKSDSSAQLLRGTVVADETFIGGSERNRHANRRTGKAKVAVLTLVSKSSGEARSRVVPNVDGRNLRRVVQRNVHHSAVLHTDSAAAYRSFAHLLAGHETVNHHEGEYVRDGKISTNQAENYFSQLKRSIDGTHHHVSEEHLPRYLAEFDFRYSTKLETDTYRMRILMTRTAGRRLTYKRIAA
jgi:transposase-like protein/polyhydroxyalkanoate synthesis regulator phasin